MCCKWKVICMNIVRQQGRIQDFKLGGPHLKKWRRAEEGANILGVFRVKNHYFTPKNHSFYNHDFTPKNIFFSNFRGGGPRAGCVPPWIRPWSVVNTLHLYHFIGIGCWGRTEGVACSERSSRHYDGISCGNSTSLPTDSQLDSCREKFYHHLSAANRFAEFAYKKINDFFMTCI